MYVCMHVYTHVHIYTCIRAYIHIYTCIYIHTYTCTCRCDAAEAALLAKRQEEETEEREQQEKLRRQLEEAVARGKEAERERDALLEELERLKARAKEEGEARGKEVLQEAERERDALLEELERLQARAAAAEVGKREAEKGRQAETASDQDREDVPHGEAAGGLQAPAMAEGSPGAGDILGASSWAGRGSPRKSASKRHQAAGGGTGSEVAVGVLAVALAVVAVHAAAMVSRYRG